MPAWVSGRPATCCGTASDPKGREDLAAAAGITNKLILRWVNQADLFRIKGVGEQYADLLEAAGVDTVPELAQRRAGNLTKKMNEVNEQKRAGAADADRSPGRRLDRVCERSAEGRDLLEPAAREPAARELDARELDARTLRTRHTGRGAAIQSRAVCRGDTGGFWGRHSSMVEQLICNQQVGGSSPFAGFLHHPDNSLQNWLLLLLSLLRVTLCLAFLFRSGASVLLPWKRGRDGSAAEAEGR